MPSVHAARRAAARAVMAENGAGLLVEAHLPNVQYLTGFSGSNAVLLLGPTDEDSVLGTDGRYTDQAEREAPDLPRHIDRDTLVALLPRMGRQPAIDSAMPAADWLIIQQALPAARPVSGWIEGLRAVKDDVEMAALARACQITATAMGLLADSMRTGDTEVALARRLEGLFGELGADERAFPTIVGSGPHAAIPHHQPGRRALERGDLVVVDAGARVDGYHADMTRTFVVGEPHGWQVELHAAVLQAQQAATAAYMPGAARRDIDGVARAVLSEAGLGDRFTHGLGHGVGLEIHEAPMIGPRSTGTIGEQMAITVEPGAYLPDRGGVRIEDTLVVTDAGPRILTEAPRDLRPVG